MTRINKPETGPSHLCQPVGTTATASTAPMVAQHMTTLLTIMTVMVTVHRRIAVAVFLLLVLLLLVVVV